MFKGGGGKRKGGRKTSPVFGRKKDLKNTLPEKGWVKPRPLGPPKGGMRAVHKTGGGDHLQGGEEKVY